MSKYQHALQDLADHENMDSRALYIISLLTNAGLPCRTHDSREYLENLADAVYHLWNHLCQLDDENLKAWDIGVHELASIYGEACGARTFHKKKEVKEDKVLLALGDMIENFERFVDRPGTIVAGFDRDREILRHAKEVYDEAERWPTTGSEESFCKLSSEQMLRAGFTPSSATHAEFQAFRDKCDEEDEEAIDAAD